MTPAKLASALLRPLISNGFTTYPFASVFGGRKYSISSSKSEEMLLMALDRHTIEEKIRALEIAVLCGADINQEIREYNNESVLEIICGFTGDHIEKDFAPITQKLLSLGARINFGKYQQGSPLHDIMFFSLSLEKKLAAIEIFTRYMSVNHLDNENSTPLDYALYFRSNYFESNPQGRKTLLSALLERGAIQGYGLYSSSLLTEFPPPMAKVAFHLKDIIAQTTRLK